MKKQKMGTIAAPRSPRIRLWRDRQYEWHIAGEPEGFRTVLTAFRRIASRISDRVSVNLRTEPILRNLDPAAHAGVLRAYERLELSFGRGTLAAPTLVEAAGSVRSHP